MTLRRFYRVIVFVLADPPRVLTKRKTVRIDVKVECHDDCCDGANHIFSCRSITREVDGVEIKPIRQKPSYLLMIAVGLSCLRRNRGMHACASHGLSFFPRDVKNGVEL